jgi:hypothetical protein
MVRISLVAQASRLCMKNLPLAQEGQMPTCKCGCEGETRRGKFQPGHDQILQAKLAKKVGEGGLLNLKALVEDACDYANGRITLESFGQRVKSIIPKKSMR